MCFISVHLEYGRLTWYKQTTWDRKNGTKPGSEFNLSKLKDACGLKHCSFRIPVLVYGAVVIGKRQGNSPRFVHRLASELQFIFARAVYFAGEVISLATSIHGIHRWQALTFTAVSSSPAHASFSDRYRKVSQPLTGGRGFSPATARFPPTYTC